MNMKLELDPVQPDIVGVAGHLGEPVLLPVWLPVPRLCHPDHLRVTNLHCHGLLPAVRRGNTLTVALFVWPRLCRVVLSCSYCLSV